jgi:putative ABC transport system permease protein
VVGGSKTALYLLLGSVALLLLIACANVAGLLLARGAARGHEMAVRLALGAGRERILRLLLTESLVLAVLAGVAGLGIGFGILRIARPLLAAVLPRAEEIGWDAKVLFYAAAMALVTCLVFGIAPAWRATRTASAAGSLAGAGRRTHGRGQGLLRGSLVAAQVALSLVLLVAAGTLLENVVRLLRADTGLDARNVLTFRVSWVPPQPGINPSQHAVRIAQFYDSLLQRLRNLPGVEAAAATATLPLNGGEPFLQFRIEGEAPLPVGQEKRVDQQRCTADYFRAMGIQLLKGRAFDQRDGFVSPQVAVINEVFARRFLTGREPLGQRVVFDDGGGPRTIVGVIANVRHRNLADPATAEVYLSQAQWPSSGMAIVLKTAADPGSLAAPIRAAVRSVDRGMPISAVATMDDLVAGTIAGRRYAITPYKPTAVRNSANRPSPHNSNIT